MRLLFLAYYHRKYMQPLANYAGQLRAQRAHVTEMYPDNYYREDVLREMASGGYDCLIYFGHGIPGKWLGYGSIGKVQIRELDFATPARLLLSLSCYGFTPDRYGESLCSCFLRNRVAEWIVGYGRGILYRHNLEVFRLALSAIVRKGIPEDPAMEFRQMGLVARRSGLAVRMKSSRNHPSPAHRTSLGMLKQRIPKSIEARRESLDNMRSVQPDT